MRIESAVQADQSAILQLEQTIFDDMALPIYDELSVDDVQQAMALAVAKSEKSRYHFSRAVVAKSDDNEVLGVLFGFPDSEEEQVDHAFQSILADKFSYHRWMFEDAEAFSNEWYIDSIVVTSAARGQGIGTQLLKYIEAKAKRDGQKVLGLNVDNVNPRARKLYESLGFSAVGALTLENHHYTHLQKSI